MLAIRMRRVGSKKKPYFRVVVTEAKSARESSFVENVGTYNPRSKPAVVEINKERIQHWIKLGAQPSDSVRTLLAKHLTQGHVEAGGGSRAVMAEQDGGPGSPLRAVVEVVVKTLVDHPESVKVTESVRRGMTVVELSTAPGDMGKIIGRQGRTAAAIRTLVALTAERHGVRAQLDIRD